MRRLLVPLLAISAALVVAGGAMHLRDWLGTYRGIPWAVPGAWVVRVGFPVNAVMSVVFVVALLAIVRWRRYAVHVIAAAVAFQLTSFAALILSRHGGIFGWVEPGWTMEARQIATVEVLAALALGAAGAVSMSTWPARQARTAS